MSGDERRDRRDRRGEIVAVLVVVVFLIGQLVSYFDRGFSVPVEFYPGAFMALGYLCGYGLMKNGGAKK